MKIVEILLTYNADPYVCDHQSYMPIHTAAECGYEKIIRVLIEDGVDVNVQTDLQEYTALHIAALKGHESVTKYLLTVEGRFSLYGRGSKSKIVTKSRFSTKENKRSQAVTDCTPFNLL